eukprot:gnl/TRDRNA2_/TRDRNA2_173334_c0_seq3.p1 gnl/TRDRNA2_/TRDRNA2_173334_c0~~gnl/TRDRNA2_/TRDRNA2_173334_c0_seq3.p1  ORF type:complete len:464 (-),score=99.24 gnl/TRDRNA2_/TRDRNA2_173334_c0_seq3:95-1363(-)
MGNAIIIGLETDQGPTKYIIFEHLFCVFFIGEMFLRIRQLKRLYVYDPWNIFDFTLVCTGTFELWIFPYINKNKKGASGIQLLRLLRMARVLRVLRLFRMFKMLTLIMDNFKKASKVVIWVVILMLIFDYIWAILLTQVIGHNASSWNEEAEDIQVWFGTIPASMQTLFTVMTLTEWQTIARTLEQVIPRGVIFPCFIAYIFFAAYTMISLITAMIAETLIISNRQTERSDEIARQHATLTNRQALLRGLTQFLAVLDEDGDGHVQRHEIKHCLKVHPEIVTKLNDAFDIQVTTDELLELFYRLNNGKPVPIELFVEALSNLSGEAKAWETRWFTNFDLKRIMLNAREEAEEEAAKHKKDIHELRQGMHSAHEDGIKIKTQIADFSTDLNHVKNELANIQSFMTGVTMKLDEVITGERMRRH